MDQPDPDFEALLVHLRETRGFDFTGYKRTSLMRRVDRRINDLEEVAGYADYVDYLEVHPDEFTLLFNTVLINVTDFFRDADAWEQLGQEVAPRLLALRSSEPIRVWSAGCATGQEAYSIAIMLAELMGVEEFRDRVKIYATDVDEDALAYARQGDYSEREVAGVSPGRLQEWFEPRPDGSYGFRKDLRRSLIFGRNDLVQDAPISRIDLLLCRNTLMYFNAETQGRILQRLHFALKPGSVLFLGKAEVLLSHSALFAPVDGRRRFFSRSTPGTEGQRAPAGLAAARAHPTGTSGEQDDRLRDTAWLTTPSAQVVLDARGRLAHSNHRAETVFGVSSRDHGRPFQDLELSYRPVELRAHLEQARADRRPVWVKDVEWARPSGERTYFDVQVTPLLADDGRALGTALVFNDVSRYHQLHAELEFANRQLEAAYEELQSTNEELETTNEELQSTVEELETTNEELQSTNEELETMNEELQSMNDALQSTNEELRARTGEVSSLNGFLESIFRSLRSCVIVVDADWVVRVWNRRAEDLWGVRSEEAVGEHLLSLDIGLPLEAVKPLVRAVLHDGPATQGGDAHPHDVELAAVNRRGRSIRVRVTCSSLSEADGGSSGTILLVDQIEP
ncbi:CheR family methyltransferase [Motilibacter aurantiacus]|uniref:CheR family methyltransferase n=1 Tax=Motilibacter aurantiacus TaxID=2714955 RepID=UPI001407BA5A|nr:CheR family methyltransferase [Motilibacter aurantiacus]NHC44836.1 PAS domain S-box protein [Motilibacter aurantiacus]